MILLNLKPNAYYESTKTLDANNYKLTVRWNTYTSKWYMDIVGKTNDVDIKGIALLTGKDLLAPYGYYELGQLWVVDNSGGNTDPDFDNIGGQYTVEYTSITE